MNRIMGFKRVSRSLDRDLGVIAKELPDKKQLEPKMNACLADVEQPVRIAFIDFHGHLLKVKVEGEETGMSPDMVNTVKRCLLLGFPEYTVLQATTRGSGNALVSMGPPNSHKGIVLEREMSRFAQETGLTREQVISQLATFGDDCSDETGNDFRLLDPSKCGYAVAVGKEPPAQDGGGPERLHHKKGMADFLRMKRQAGEKIRFVVADFDGTMLLIGDNKVRDELCYEVEHILDKNDGYLTIATGGSQTVLNYIKEWLRSLHERGLLTHVKVDTYGGNLSFPHKDLNDWVEAGFPPL